MAKTMPWEKSAPVERFVEPSIAKAAALEEEKRHYVEGATTPPALSRRMWLAIHAPGPPNWWTVRTPRDLAIWAWTWADSLLATEELKTTPGDARQPR